MKLFRECVPGIDLLTGPAVVVRAYLESFVLASKTGDIDDAYPGFKSAVDTTAPSAKAAWPWPNTPTSIATRGYIRLE